MLVSLAACLGAFVLLYRLSEATLGPDAARRTVVYLAICPMALFLGAVYSESLYLLLAVAAFALAERGRFLEAGVVVGLAILTRATGVALLPALAVLAWPRRRDLLKLAVAIPIAAIYPLVLWRQVGDPWAFWGAQDLWHRHLSWAGPFGGIWDGVHALWGPTPSAAAPMHASAVNIEGVRRTRGLRRAHGRRLAEGRRAYGLFAALSLAIPLSLPSSRWPLLSLPRFGLVIFPLFMALAVIGARPRAHTVIVAASALLLGVAVTQWALWQWVS